MGRLTLHWKPARLLMLWCAALGLTAALDLRALLQLGGAWSWSWISPLLSMGFAGLLLLLLRWRCAARLSWSPVCTVIGLAELLNACTRALLTGLAEKMPAPVLQVALVLLPVLVGWFATGRLWRTAAQGLAPGPRALDWAAMGLLWTGQALVPPILGAFVLLWTTHSDALLVPMPASIYAMRPEPRSLNWSATGEGYLLITVHTGEARTSPGVQALIDLRQPRALRQLPRATPDALAEAILKARSANAPAHIAVVFDDGDFLSRAAPAVQRALFAHRGAGAALGWLPDTSSFDLEGYVRRMRALEQSPVEPMTSALIVAEVGAGISPYCRHFGAELSAALNAADVASLLLPFDNTGPVLTRAALEPAANAQLLVLIGHGVAWRCAGIESDQLPAQLAGQPVVVSGCCEGARIASGTVANTLLQRGAVAIVSGTDIHGWWDVANFLPHALEGQATLGEAWRRAQVEAWALAEGGGAPSTDRSWMPGLQASSFVDALERAVLLGDPALRRWSPLPGEQLSAR